MSLNVARTAENHAAPPSLAQLQALVAADMEKVNALTLKRIESHIDLISTLARHLIASGGKRIRPSLVIACARLCDYRGERHVPVATSVEFIHTATLLHDDVVDESKLRRGTATANDVWGNKASVLVGDFLLSQAFQIMVGEQSLRMLEILSKASAIIAQGEVMQLLTDRNLDTPQERYLEVISAKTAALFAAACELGAVVAGRVESESKLRRFGQQLGLAFQLVDDVLDYSATQSKFGKTVGDDFRDGKITLPVILAYERGTDEEKSFWSRTLVDGGQTPEDLARAMELVVRTGALNDTLALAKRYCDEARKALADFAPGAAKEALIETVDFCAGRAY